MPLDHPPYSKLVSLLLLCCIPTAAFSLCQPIEKKQYTQHLREFSLQRLMQTQVKIASKTPEKALYAASSVSVFNADELANMGISTLDELLNFVPGFISEREIVFGQGSMVAARGRTTPQASYNILFLLNGMRLNNEKSGGAFSYQRFIRLANIEQVEIIRGPGSALYGTGAFSGVVNIITKQQDNNLFIGAGSDGAREAYVNFSTEADDWLISGFVGHFHDDGQLYDVLTPPPGFTEVKQTSDPRSGSDFYLDACNSRWRLSLHHMQRDIQGFYFVDTLADETNLAQVESSGLALSYQLWKRANAQLELSFNYQHIDDDLYETRLSAAQMQAFNLAIDPAQAWIYTQFNEEEEWSLHLDGHYQFSAEHQLSAGLEFRRPNTLDDGLYSNYQLADYALATTTNPEQLIRYASEGFSLGESTVAHEDRHILGAYVQERYRFNPSWATTLGLRYDHYSDFGSHLSPRVALLYSINEQHHLKLMYGEAFRAPSRRQLWADRVGNPQLQPEVVRTLEFAWLYENSHLQTSLSHFYSRYTDLIDTIVLDATPENWTRSFVNLPGHLDNAGLEWELIWQIDPQWSLRSAYAYVYKTEENPRRFPRQTLSFIGNYQYQQWNVNLSAYYHSGVEQQTLSSITALDSYWVAYLGMSYQIAPDLILRGRVHNLLDEDYSSSSKMPYLSQGLPNRGRSYSLGIEWRF